MPYHYNWVLHPKIMVSVGNTTGVGINFLNDAGESSASLLWESIFRGRLSYNASRFFGGVDFSYAFFGHSRVREVRVDDRIYFATLYIG
ncbi:MAG: DUF4421 family protein [Robiginitalea sp.]